MPDHAPSRHPAAAYVSLDRIRQNLRALRAFAPTKTVIPVLKANAYGHGAVPIARALEDLGVAMFAVAYVDEAIALRRAGIQSDLLLLTGFAPDQLPEVAAFNLTPVVSTRDQVEAIEAFLRDQESCSLVVHLKVDTGMSRLGFSVREIEPVVHRLEDLERVEVLGLMTHLASADEDEVATMRQLDLFDEAIVRLQTLGHRPPFIHAANSAGMAFVRETHTAVRPGLLLYGVRPRPLAPSIAVEPAMEVRARVALTRTIAPGVSVSYGGRFVAERETRIAAVNLGYGDGVPRTAAMRERGRFQSGASLLPVAGTVCMDLTMLDVTDSTDVTDGGEVTFLGGGISAWDVAEWAGSNAWQVLTAIGARVPRVYTLNGAIVSAEELATIRRPQGS